MSTSCGTIVVELDPELAPQGVNSFVFLAEEGFYDGTVFHRIIGTFVAQGGDPQADGQGNAGYTLPNESPPEGFVYEPGVMALANAPRPQHHRQPVLLRGRPRSRSRSGPTSRCWGGSWR